MIAFHTFLTQTFGKRPVSAKFISRVIVIVLKECTDHLQQSDAENFIQLVTKRNENWF